MQQTQNSRPVIPCWLQCLIWELLGVGLTWRCHVHQNDTGIREGGPSIDIQTVAPVGSTPHKVTQEDE